jgi:hypothetical protein
MEKIMPLIDMTGPYPLTEEDIDSRFQEKIGNYALGVAAKNIMAVKYVGRSDTNLNQRLKDHLGEEGYNAFEFAYTGNPELAYRKECRDFHAFVDRGFILDNKIHPDKPKGASLTLVCPVCGQ